MSTTTETIELSAKNYEDHDDCLAAAIGDVCDEHGVEAWQCDAAWEDDQRETIVVTIRRQVAS